MNWLSKSARAVIRLLDDRQGAALVEWAFVGPIAILLTLGTLETGRALFAEAAITQAVKETARFASVRGAASGTPATVDQLEAMARQLADLPDANTTVAVVWSPDNMPGSVVTVTMQHDFEPVVAPFEGSTFTFDATASMTIVR